MYVYMYIYTYMDGLKWLTVTHNDFFELPQLWRIGQGALDPDGWNGSVLVLGNDTPEISRNGAQQEAGAAVFPCISNPGRVVHFQQFIDSENVSGMSKTTVSISHDSLQICSFDSTKICQQNGTFLTAMCRVCRGLNKGKQLGKDRYQFWERSLPIWSS